MQMGSYYYVHFTNDEFEVQRSYVTSSKVTELAIELGCEPRLAGPSCLYHVTTFTNLSVLAHE